jgi:hypothetical protein
MLRAFKSQKAPEKLLGAQEATNAAAEDADKWCEMESEPSEALSSRHVLLAGWTSTFV